MKRVSRKNIAKKNDKAPVNPPPQKRHAKGAEKPAPRIVGMGGSAGGLEAFEQFFSRMPFDTGMAFVLVQHLDPTHKGIMAEILQRQTKMSVVQIEDGMRLKENCIYVIPPNADLSILRGVLHLLEPSAPAACACPSISFSANWPKTSAKKPSASCFPAWEPTAAWA